MIFVVDPDNGYKQIARLDFYIKSILWKEYMLNETGGEFTIVLNGGDAKDYIANDMMLINTNGFKIGFIKSIVYKMKQQEIEEITVSGKMAETILERRIVKGQMQLKGTIKQIITDILNRNVINTSVSDSNIPIKLNFIGSFSNDEQTFIAEDGKKISSCMSSLCMTNNLLYYFTIENNELVLNFKNQEDKSYILFGSDSSNIYDVTTKETTEEKANATVVKGDILNQSVPYVYVADKSAKGIHWIETFVDKSSELDSENVDEETYLKGMKQIGKENLAIYQIRRAFDGATFRSKYNYPDEIFLGDVVTVDVGGIREPQRIVSYFYSLSNQNKEEVSFTLSQVPIVITDIDSYVILGDVPEEDLDDVVSDATSEGANKTNGGGGVEIVGRVMCIDNELIDGTIEKIGKDLYRINIYTWNDNKTVTTTDDNGNEITSQQIAPYKGKIYLGCPFNILSYVKNGTDTIDIDNFDNSKTRIKIDTAAKGVLFIDKEDPNGPPLFEMPTEQNAGEKAYYEYEIESENLNFNFSAIVSIDPVRDILPLKTYSKSYPTMLKSSALYFRFNIWKGYSTYYNEFLPTNFYADDGDYVQMYVKYWPIHHELKDGKTVFRWYDSEMIRTTIKYDFRKGEIVADKRIRWGEGVYSFYWFTYDDDGLGYGSSFKKLNYIKNNYSNNSNAGFIGKTELRTYNKETGVIGDPGFLGFAIIKLDPAFDIVDDLNDVTWICKHIRDTTTYSNAVFDSSNWQNSKDFPAFFICTDVSSQGDSNCVPMKYLERLCENPDRWQQILDEEAAKEEEGSGETT